MTEVEIISKNSIESFLRLIPEEEVAEAKEWIRRRQANGEIVIVGHERRREYYGSYNGNRK